MATLRQQLDNVTNERDEWKRSANHALACLKKRAPELERLRLTIVKIRDLTLLGGPGSAAKDAIRELCNEALKVRA